MGGFSWSEMMAAPANRDIKTYLHFDQQRRIVATSEDQAVDVALRRRANLLHPEEVAPIEVMSLSPSGPSNFAS